MNVQISCAGSFDSRIGRKGTELATSSRNCSRTLTLSIVFQALHLIAPIDEHVVIVLGVRINRMGYEIIAEPDNSRWLGLALASIR